MISKSSWLLYGGDSFGESLYKSLCRSLGKHGTGVFSVV